MAAENSDDHLAPPQLSHPEYPEMVMAAIEALNDGNGSSTAAISAYIESTYGDLPPDHGELLSEHLNKMKDSGPLAMVNDNYMKLDAAPPAKRGRGRPPKAKAAVIITATTGAGPMAPPADATVASPPRGRGRPPKSKDPLAPPPQPKPKSPTKSGRPRGRPPKKAKTTPSPAPTSAPATATAPATGAPRGRGRPPKVKPAVVPVGC